MAATDSYLSNAPYGYDFVVASTQASINATMKAYLSLGSQPEVNICFVADAAGNPVQIAYADLKQRAKGSDPFSVPNGANVQTNPDLINLVGARFMTGFKAQIGLPPGLAPQDIPDVVTLGANTASVTFNLLCSEFIVVELQPGSGYAPSSWLNVSQPDGAPWLFTSKVDLRMFATDPSAYSTLPPDVQAEIANLGAQSFSVQQLLFDLANAALETVPTISGVAPGTNLYTALETDFLGAYFGAMQAGRAPLLGCTITVSGSDPSTLTLTNLSLNVDPLLDGNGQPIPDPTPAQQQLATLNYLCEANNDPPHAPVPFTWNWVDDITQSDGVVSVNRDTLAAYLAQQLMGYVTPNCFAPYVRVWLSGFFDQNVHYEWNMTPNQSPTVAYPASGSTVVTFSYSNYAEDQAGANGWMGHMTLQPAYNASVQFIENTIVITQHLVVYLYVSSMGTSGSGNVIDKQIVDTYTIAVDDTGHLVVSAPASVITDNSDNPSVNPFLNFFVDIQDVIDSVAQWMQNFIGTSLTDIPLAVAERFIFPGGNTFVFKDVGFSTYQDLVGHINYADPADVHTTNFFALERAGALVAIPADAPA